MKQTTQTSEGTSFHNDTIRVSVTDLRQILGEPQYEQNDGSDKVNFDWVMETEDGEVFTIYDWKEYRRLSEDEIIEWHIGGASGRVTSAAVNELKGVFQLLKYTL
jgi:hypothetical protein